MRLKPSLSTLSPSVAPYTGNESIIVNNAVQFFGNTTYAWNTRYVALIDSFFQGIPIESLTKNTKTPLIKFIAFANGTLPVTDIDYDILAQYNEYLATL